MSQEINTPTNSSKRPDCRSDEIHTLINTLERYNGNNVPKLESYLEQQCQSSEESNNYDLQANLALLKLYQFNPKLFNEKYVVKILGKALMAIPGPDFNLYLYMLNEQFTSISDISSVIELKDLLESAHYTRFWEVLKENPGLKSQLESIVGFVKNIQVMIACNIATTYQTIYVTEAKSYLGFEDDEGFTGFISKEGWSVDKSDQGLINLPLHKQNEAKTVVISEQIRFAQLTKVIASSH
ncbi:hypothetical protein H4219_000917 [Mycoemilia scoparia]|uniref:Eukaryotic translation initiation factor 3 subunit K n=1 Tax=Mycoemilia scoparia TaxID=417184 RepID=A0A9W8DWR8_9FUNG|nr:hypothetical protein H4219_000917 [Mycoemilia scoparia]